MAYALADEQWECVRSLLPEDLEGLARKHGAIQRRRRGKIRDAETLLRLLLLHVAGGLSLEQTSLRAREQGLVWTGRILYKMNREDALHRRAKHALRTHLRDRSETAVHQ